MTSKITKAEKFGTLVRAFFVLLTLMLYMNNANAQCTSSVTGVQNWSALTFSGCPAAIKTPGSVVDGPVTINDLGNGETLSFDINLRIQNGALNLSNNASGMAYFVVKAGKTVYLQNLNVGTNITIRVEAGGTLDIQNTLTTSTNVTLDIFGTLITDKINAGNYGTLNVNTGSTLTVRNNFQFGNNATLNINKDITLQSVVLGTDAKINVNNATLSTQNDFKTGDNAIFSGNGNLHGSTNLILGTNPTCGPSGCPSLTYQSCSGGGTTNFCDKVCKPNTTINVGNAGSITGTDKVCPGQTDVTYSVGAISSAKSYIWTVPAGASIASGSGTNQIKVSFSTAAVDGKITVRGAACGYFGTISEFSVDVKDAPTLANLPSNITVCAGKTVPVSTIATNGTINWTSSATSIGLAASGSGQIPEFTAVNETSADITATIQVSATLVGCTTTTSSYTITVKPNPAPVVNDVTRCGSGYVKFNSIPGRYRGYKSETGSDIWGEATVDSYEMYVTTTTVLWVTRINNGCESARVKVTATVIPLPSDPGVTNPSPICDKGDVTFKASGASSSEVYRWYTSTATGATPLSFNGADLTRNISTTTTYYVSKYNASTGCESARKPITATVNKTVVAPNITITSNVAGTICPGKSVTFSATLADAATGTYQWKIGSTNVGTSSSTFTTDQLQNNDQVTCTFTPTAVCYVEKTSNALTIPVTAQNTWSGTLNSDWNNASNWCGGIPTITQDIVIPSGTANAPTISSHAYARNLIVNSGATLTIASGATTDFRGDVVINGNWVESGSGTITIAGDADFTNSNSGNSLESLSALRVDGLLTFPSNGKISMIGNGILILGADASYTGNSETKFVEGKMRKIFASTKQFEFPLGSGTIPGKIAITPVSASPQSYFTVSYFRENPKVAVNDEDRTNPSDPDYLFKVSDVEYWTYEGSSGASAKASLFWSANSYVNENGDLSDLKISTYNATRSVWQALTTALDEGNSVQLFASTTRSISTVNPISDNGILTLGSSTTIHNLPVSIADFNLTSLNNAVELKWKSTAASAGRAFEVQRSINGFKTFETLATVDAPEGASYSYLDIKAEGPVIYYRLKQTGSEEADAYSEIKSISFNRISSSKLYPNPTQGDVVVDIEEITSEQQVQYLIVSSDGLTKARGAKVSGRDVSSELSKDIQHLKVGTYTVFIKTSKTNHSIKLIKI